MGGGRGCAGALTRPSTRHLLPKNFEKTGLKKRGGIFAEMTVLWLLIPTKEEVSEKCMAE